MPPHDLDAEAAVLSAVMVDQTAFDKVAALIKHHEFYSEAHRRIFEACVDLSREGKPVDVVQVATWLRDRDRLAQVGGMPYLTEVLNAAPAVANVEAYARTIHEKHRVRQLILTCQRVTAQGYAGYGDAREFIDGAEAAVYAVASESAESEAGVIKDVLRAAWTSIQAAQKRGGGVTGLPTGFDRYDRMTSGLHGGELTIVAARPGMGKTTFALQLAVNACALPVLESAELPPGWDTPPKAYGAIVFSLEMDREPIANRLLCCEARVDLSRLRAGMLTPSDWTKLSDAAGRLAAMPLWVDDAPGISLLELRTRARRLIAKNKAIGVHVVLVVVDYLQLMDGMGDEGNREQEVSGISRGLKRLSKELRLPVIALSQLNRAVETRGAQGKRPQLSDLRESGAIEQDADNICFIYRDDYYNKESNERGVAELIIAKQRNGPTDTVKVRFDAQYTRFDNLAEGEFEGDERYGD